MSQYLARYTQRVAISNHRLLAVDENSVSFRWKDYAHHNNQRVMALTLEEFLRRFLQHVLPRGFPRIRYFGWLANRKRRELLPICRDLLNAAPRTEPGADEEKAVWLCPCCHGPMQVIERLSPARAWHESIRPAGILDTS